MSAGARSERSVDAALDRAREASSGVKAPAPSIPLLHVAVGDPQAPTRRLFEILDGHGLLGPDGWLLPEVHLVSVGDHFDYGGFAERRDAGANGLRSLSWLSAHAPEQVTLIAGNHDLARVGELWNMTDERFAEAAERASSLYTARRRDERGERELLRDFPEFPSVEVLARDLATFSEAQRELVMALLGSGRLRMAHALGDVLVCHAGVTLEDLAIAAVPPQEVSHAGSVAASLNRAFDRAVSSWSGRGPLVIPELHTPGSAEGGEGGGILYHRPTLPDGDLASFSGPRRRRFDPRRLPLGLTQVIGHVRDPKCRALLGTWVTDERPVAEGSLRHLVTDGQGVRYAAGSPASSVAGGADLATLHFLDGGMNHVPPADYELCELTSLTPLARFRGTVSRGADEA